MLFSNKKKDFEGLIRFKRIHNLIESQYKPLKDCNNKFMKSYENYMRKNSDNLYVNYQDLTDLYTQVPLNRNIKNIFKSNESKQEVHEETKLPMIEKNVKSKFQTQFFDQNKYFLKELLV